MERNLLVVHGGAPTAVINASLYGVIMETLLHEEITHLYAAIGGSGGILKENFLDLKEVPQEELDLLLQTPGSAIGTSRDALEEEDYLHIAEVIEKYQIRYVLFNGGNGSMDACGRVYQACRRRKQEVCVVGIPKTIDNDLAITDHAPGYGSAARYLAETVRDICRDVRSLPIHVSVVEAMGRNVGWIAAAGALAGRDGNGPDLIYLPESPFDEDKFLADVKRIFDKKRGVVVVVSEGLKGADGQPIVEPAFTVGRAVYYGDVSAHLANRIIQKLGIKARSEKPGIAGRASSACQSSVDRDEAVLMGREAVKAAMESVTGVMIGMERVEGDLAGDGNGAGGERACRYSIRPVRIPIEKVMMYENKVPDRFINEEGNHVTEEFIEWCRPLLGEERKEFFTFNRNSEVRPL
ncbi:MAG: diphosphate--fructose-6-phosphate 1-phosphotransferase [Blautia sp.]|nr:diphosphate--fructose-6-phosphate 1-phosphotransferase [Blautia sp.]MDY4515204.1 diphosphate--fructose-6-phosphate 1-phosphotransferase [Lachnospiraceae bacterium]